MIVTEQPSPFIYQLPLHFSKEIDFSCTLSHTRYLRQANPFLINCEKAPGSVCRSSRPTYQRKIAKIYSFNLSFSPNNYSTQCHLHITNPRKNSSESSPINLWHALTFSQDRLISTWAYLHKSRTMIG